MCTLFSEDSHTPKVGHLIYQIVYPYACCFLRKIVQLICCNLIIFRSLSGALDRRLNPFNSILQNALYLILLGCIFCCCIDIFLRLNLISNIDFLILKGFLDVYLARFRGDIIFIVSVNREHFYRCIAMDHRIDVDDSILILVGLLKGLLVGAGNLNLEGDARNQLA